MSRDIRIVKCYQTGRNVPGGEQAVIDILSKAEEYFTGICNNTTGMDADPEPVELDFGCMHLVAISDDRIAGVAIIKGYSRGYGQTVLLDDLYVLPEYRREGIASMLVRYAAKWCLDHGMVMELNVLSDNKLGNAFWKKTITKKKPLFTCYHAGTDALKQFIEQKEN